MIALCAVIALVVILAFAIPAIVRSRRALAEAEEFAARAVHRAKDYGA